MIYSPEQRAEAGLTEEAGAEDEISRNADEAMDEMESENGELVTDKIIEALVLLEERTRMIGERLECIKTRLNELNSMRNKDGPEGVNEERTKIRPQG
jgi:hypothetical protein